MVRKIYELFSSFIKLFYFLYKYLLYLVTGKCSLLRIIHSKHSKSQKYIYLESNIENSGSLDKSKLLVDLPESKIKENILEVIKQKRVQYEFHEEFSHYLSNLSSLFVKYNCLIRDLSGLKETRVDTTNQEHLEQLISVWNIFKPQLETDKKLESKNWSEIGFQGKNPETDFRGMGTLGLIQLEYFATNSPKSAKEILMQCDEDCEQGFPLAIAAINFTALLFSILRDHRLKLLFYSLPADCINIDTFNKLFVAVFNAFHEHWVRENPGVMQFNVEKNKFELVLTKELNDESNFHKYI